MDKIIQDSFLALVRLGIGNPIHSSFEVNDWPAVKKLAERHGLVAIVLDGIECISDSKRPPKDYLIQWIGEKLQFYEFRYEHYRRAIAELAAFYNSHGYKMMILKGYACSLDWPNPEHRPCGDIDIWLYGKQKGGDALIIKEKGAKIDRSHHHHTVFYWHGFMVENHYDFIDIHHRKSSPKLEQVFKKLGQDESHSVDVYGERVFLPSPNLHALFLLRHMMEHFASEELTLRQLLDWALFVQAHRKKVDWKWLQGVLIQFGMFPAYNIFNAICVDNLGFNSELFPTVQFSPELKERVLADILSPEFTGEIPSHFFSRIIFRYKRWKANGWKHRLCFNESMASAFWSGVVGHLLKPASL